MTRNGPPACFAELLRNAAFDHRLIEDLAQAEMTEILRQFAQQHDEFLREQARAPAPPASMPVTRR